MPHLGHAPLFVVVEVMADLDDVGAMSSRSIIGRRDIYRRAVSVVGAGAGVHTVRDMDPEDPANMSALLAFE